MKTSRLAYFQLHFAVFLWGFTAVLGKLISIGELPLVWYRAIITALSLLLLPGLWKTVRSMSRAPLLKLAGIGCLVCLHWVCFYGSIKQSNITVSLSCLATTSFFVSLLEPLLTGKRIKPYELGLGLLVVPGVYLIYFFTQVYIAGIVLGLLAAVLAGTFTILNKMVVDTHEPRAMTFVELSSGAIFLTFLLPAYTWLFPEVKMLPSPADWGWLGLLALGCTSLPFVLALRALRQMSAFASTLTVNLEPVYGIIMAMIFFSENKDLDPKFYLGTGIILLAVFIHPWLKSRLEKPKAVNLAESNPGTN